MAGPERRGGRLFKNGRDPVVVVPLSNRLAAQAPRHGVHPVFCGLPHLEFDLALSGCDPIIDLRLPATQEWRISLRNLRAGQERAPWVARPTRHGGHTARPWTAAEDEAIHKAHAELERRKGHTRHLYARFLHHLGTPEAPRTPGGVAARCKTLHGKKRRRNSDETVYR